MWSKNNKKTSDAFSEEIFNFGVKYVDVKADEFLNLCPVHNKAYG